MKLSKALFIHKGRNFLVGLTALLVGLVTLSLVSRSVVDIRPGMSIIPPGFRLYLPGSVLLILGGIAVMVRSLLPIKHELRFCLICGLKTKHFRADPRFKDGKKIGDSYVCQVCGQKYLIASISEYSSSEDESG